MINIISILLFLGISGVGLTLSLLLRQEPIYVIPLFFLIPSAIAALSPRVLSQWEKGIILRLGKFNRIIGPGLYWIIPLFEREIMRVDTRVMATPFVAEKTLTKDTVPVNVDAVLFWYVNDATKAALQVENYEKTVAWASQTALRDIIGKTDLSVLLSERETLDKQLQETIDSKTEPWGITVQSVEIRDVQIPEPLQDTMSRQAQAEREKQARVILGDAENQIAYKFVEAAKQYEGSPVALHLRAMNILYESLKEKGTMVIVPSSAVDSMALGNLTGITALSQQLIKEKPVVADKKD